MATYYVNASASGTAGNDSANGTTTSTPWLTLGKLNDNIASGDTVYLSGEFQGGSGATNLTISGLSNVTVTQWPGMPQAWIKNSVSIARGSAWTAATAPRYQTTIATGLSLQTVSVAFGDPAFTDTNGRFKGHLELAASLADVISNDNSFWYDSGTGVLSINVNNASTDPDTYLADVEYCLSGPRTGGGYIITGENCTNCTVSFIKGRNYILTNEAGYFVFMSGTGNVISDCEFWNNGWHHVGFVSSGGSVPNVNNTIRRCTFWGGGTGTAGSSGTQTVFYANGSNVTGALIEDSIFHCYKLVTPAGLDWGAVDMNGSYTHTSGGANVVVDLTHRRCQFYGYTENRLAYGGNMQVTAGETEAILTNPASYSLKYYDCIFETRHSSTWATGTVEGDQGKRNQFIPGHAAYVRCLLSNPTIVGCFGASGFNNAFTHQTDATTWMPTLFDSCHLVYNGVRSYDASFGAGPWVGCADITGFRYLSGDGGSDAGDGRSTVTMVNTTFINNNTNFATGLCYTHLFNGTGTSNTANFNLINSVFSPSTTVGQQGAGTWPATSNRTFIYGGGTAFTTANLNVKSCWITGVPTDNYTNTAAYNTYTEFEAAVNPVASGGLYNVDPGYPPAATTAGFLARPTSGANVLRYTHSATTPRSSLGINLAKSALRYGPWQTGVVYTSSGGGTRPIYIFD